MPKFLLLLPVLLLSIGSSPALDLWVEPISQALERLERDFRAPETEYGPGHRGIDLSVGASEPISSPVTGEVAFLGKVANRMVLTIRGYDGYLASFEPLCAIVELNQEVLAGEVIGSWCEPDDSYVSHCPTRCIHLSARRAGDYLNPLWLMGLVEPSRLMPLDEPVDNLP